MNLKSRLVRLKDPKSRRKHLENSISMVMPLQIRALRKARGLSQIDLAKNMGKAPSNEAISRLERPYKSFTIKTLLDLAEQFDVALLVRFVPWSRFFKEFDDLSDEALRIPSFKDQVDQIYTEPEDRDASCRILELNGVVDSSNQDSSFRFTIDKEGPDEHAIRA